MGAAVFRGNRLMKKSMQESSRRINAWASNKCRTCGGNGGGHFKKCTDAKKRLEYLRGQIEAENIRYAEIAELQSLAEYIEPGDVVLLEWADAPEHVHTYKADDVIKDWNGKGGYACTSCGKVKQ